MAHSTAWLVLVACMATLASPAYAEKAVTFQLDESSTQAPEEADVAATEDPNAPDFQPSAFDAPRAKPARTAARTAAPIAKPATPQPRDIPLIDPQNVSTAQDDVTYVTGGIGEDEKAAIEAAKADYNVHITNSSADGAYVGEVRVKLMQTHGSMVEEKLSVAAGPLLYVRLPAGKYTLEARLGEQVKHQEVSVARKGQPVRIQLVWKSSAH